MPNYKTLSCINLKDVNIYIIHFLDSNEYGVLSEYDWGHQLAVRVKYESAAALYNKLISEA